MKRLLKGITVATMVISSLVSGVFATPAQVLKIWESNTLRFEVATTSYTNTNNVFDIIELDGRGRTTISSNELKAQISAKGPVIVRNTEDCMDFKAFKLTYDGKQYTFDYSLDMQPYDSGQLVVDDMTNDSVKESTIDATDPRLGSGLLTITKVISGSRIDLSDPGYYLIEYWNDITSGLIQAFIVVDGGSGIVPTASTASAYPTSSDVTVNGKSVSFEAYNIKGNNYFKLRDLALALNGTTKQFNVSWDGAKNVINLVSNTAYIATGGELAAGDGKTKTGTLSTSAIYKDGATAALTAYNINGNNYFKLRDIASAFNIGVTFDSATSTVGIDTSTGYTA